MILNICILNFYKKGDVIMCGMTGFVSFKKSLKKQCNVLIQMTNTLIKRGPDQYGYYYSDHAMLGHRRLTVVDPTGGLQPMEKTIDSANYIIVYNGELYNTEELRLTLKNRGFTFNSYSDTEVLLTAYIAWGPECVHYLNGIFAFGVWNEKDQSLFLCRDPLGVKPLYYTVKEDTLIFASELKALLANPMVEPILDEKGICEIMGLGPAHSLDSGIFKDVYQLPPAHCMLYTKNVLKSYEYWSLKNIEHSENEKDTIEHVRSLLLDAINRQLIADVPICTFLSGGLDSSLISAVAAKEFKIKGHQLNTYSIDYEDSSKHFKSSDFTPTSDAEWADKMADVIGSNHHNIQLNNKALVAALEDAVLANDLPGMADIDSSLFLFCKEVKKTATVALSGECADEIFGGYPWYMKPELANLNTFPWSNSIKERQQLLSPNLNSIDLAGYVQAQYEDTIKKVPTRFDKPNEIDSMKRMFYLNIKWFMVTLLTRKDRMSMANSLEVRVPFADYRLVEYAFNIPQELKFLGGREKGLLRQALTGLLPEEILWRKKSPYPKTFNPEYTKDVQKWMLEILKDKNSPVLQIINERVASEIVKSGGQSFGKPWFGQLMAGPQLIAYLVQIDLWLRKYKVRIEL
jgi:asparagine synthase (glutamine-hydrolysing)